MMIFSNLLPVITRKKHKEYRLAVVVVYSEPNYDYSLESFCDVLAEKHEVDCLLISNSLKDEHIKGVSVPLPNDSVYPYILVYKDLVTFPTSLPLYQTHSRMDALHYIEEYKETLRCSKSKRSSLLKYIPIFVKDLF